MDNIEYIKAYCKFFDNDSVLIDEGTKLQNYLMGVNHFFSVCENKTVLEIGPFAGLHTALIDNYKPKHITLVEPNTECTTMLTNQFPNATLVPEDIFLFLEKSHKTDVVVCCGVLYHLHSPLYLLELIANRVDPEYVILESVVLKGGEATDWAFFARPEIDNIPGNRFISADWKSAGLCIEFSQFVIDYAMNKLGYSIVKSDTEIDRFDLASKNLVTFTLYKKND